MTEKLPVPVDADLIPEVVAWKTAQRLARTVFVPTSFRNKPEETFAAILWGRELGWGPVRSVNSIDVIQGKPTLTAEAMRAEVRARGHQIRTTEYTRQKVTLVGVRADTGETETVSWDMDDAKGANLNTKDNWKAYPRAMLLARATSELCRLLFPDVIAGSSYTPEELGEERLPDTEPDDVEDAVIIDDAGSVAVDGEVQSPTLLDDERPFD